MEQSNKSITFSDLQGLEKLTDGTYKVRDKLYGPCMDNWVGEVIKIDDKIFPNGTGCFYDENDKEMKKEIKKEMQSVKGDINFYTGECKNGEKEGYGAIIYEDGSFYEGEWKYSMRNGKGTCRCADGDIYEGEWKYGIQHGKGKMFFANGDIYEGEWRGGKKEGWGKFTSKNGIVYTGQLKDGKPYGQGTMNYLNGDIIYDGEWENGKKHGKGTFIFKNDVFYEGTFENGFAIDFSKIIITDSNNKPHTITKKDQSYFYKVGEVETEIDIENEKRLESVLLQFGNTQSNQEGALEMADHEKLDEFIKSEIASSYNEAKFYVIEIPGHAFTMLFEEGKAYCIDDGSIKKSKKWYNVIKNNNVEYVKLSHEPNLKFQLKDGSSANIPIKTNTDQFCCRHDANVIFAKLTELKNKLKEKESRNDLKEDESLYNELFKYLQEVSKENKSSYDRLYEFFTGVSGEEPELFMRINSRDDSSKSNLSTMIEPISSDTYIDATQDESKSKETPENQVQVNQKSSENCFMSFRDYLTSFCCGGTTTRL